MALSTALKIFSPFVKNSQKVIAKTVNLRAHGAAVAKMMGRGARKGFEGLQAAAQTVSAPFPKMRKVTGKFSRLGGYGDPRSAVWRSKLNETIAAGATRGGKFVASAGKGVAQSTFLSHKPYLLLGATAMASIGVMNGAMSQANDIAMERYLRDQRYGLNMMRNASLGKASAGPRLSLGNHTGLSLALSKTRHGH